MFTSPDALTYWPTRDLEVLQCKDIKLSSCNKHLACTASTVAASVSGIFSLSLQQIPLTPGTQDVWNQFSRKWPALSLFQWKIYYYVLHWFLWDKTLISSYLSRWESYMYLTRQEAHLERRLSSRVWNGIRGGNQVSHNSLVDHGTSG